MADDPELSARVRRALEGVPHVEERRMFGSLGFLVEGTLRLGVGSHPDHVMLVRAGAAQDGELERDGVGPAVMRGRPMSGWLFLERRAVESDDDLAHWVDVALAAVPAG